MKRYTVIFSFILMLVACRSKETLPDFIKDDSKENMEKQADKALQEANQLLDSLEQTPILKPKN
ncbi:MAG: hypothetical protein M9887_04635 [Chitinophagales bacterium]|nr:hypothetical protein [Chitinophagales bacterium]